MADELTRYAATEEGGQLEKADRGEGRRSTYCCLGGVGRKRRLAGGLRVCASAQGGKEAPKW